MYIPNWFREERREVLHDLMRRNSFATLVTYDGERPFASHLPFFLDAEQGEHGTLRAHLARANEQWQHFAAGREAMVLFQGAHAYISPTWYEKQPSVPTWNYAVVHAYGVPRLLDDEAFFRLLHDLVAVYEPQPDALDMPEAHVRKLMPAIVGFEIEITRLEGKFKLGQNRSETDYARVITALRQSSDPLASALADLMRTSLIETE